MVEALDALPLPPLSFQFNNRKLIQGFYRGPRPARRHRCDPHHRQARQAARGRRRRAAGQRGRRDPGAGASVPRARHDPHARHVVRRRGSARSVSPTTSSRKAWPSSPRSSRAARPAGTDASPSRPTCGSPAASTTTPAPSSRSSWRGYERLKSVGGGGRYDALASDGRTTYPGVGVSFGVSRTLVPLLADGVLTGSRPVPSAVLVAVTDEESRPRERRRRRRPARPRRADRGVAQSAQKFGKQIRYAERRGIPYVLFPQRRRRPTRSKDIRTGDQCRSTRPPGPHPPRTCARRSSHARRHTRDPHP